MIVPSAQMMPMSVTMDYNLFRRDVNGSTEETLDGVLQGWHAKSRLPDPAPGATRRDMITAVGYALVVNGAEAVKYEIKGNFKRNADASGYLITGQREEALRRFSEISAQLYWMEGDNEKWSVIYNHTKDDEMAAKVKVVAKKAVAKKPVEKKPVEKKVDNAPMGTPIEEKVTVKESTPRDYTKTMKYMIAKLICDQKLQDEKIVKEVNLKFKDADLALSRVAHIRRKLNAGTLGPCQIVMSEVGLTAVKKIENV